MFIKEFLCVLCFYIYTVIWAELPEINLKMMMIMLFKCHQLSRLTDNLRLVSLCQPITGLPN